MRLLTAAIISKLKKSPLGSHDSQKVTPIIVKFFTPDSSWTWYATEGELTEDGWNFFGLVEGHESELGYFNLSELQSARGGLGLKIERDMYFDGMVLDTTTFPATVRKAEQS
jgi:Protein of unknown function (DUF2958)